MKTTNYDKKHYKTSKGRYINVGKKNNYLQTCKILYKNGELHIKKHGR
jgi:hypothetical protein